MLVSEIISEALHAEIVRRGVGVRKFETDTGLPKWSLRGVLDPTKKNVPSVDRANEICKTIGLELCVVPMRPRRRGRRVSVDSDAPITDEQIAIVLAAIADDYERSDDRARESLVVRFWSSFPDLKARQKGLGKVISSMTWRSADIGVT